MLPSGAMSAKKLACVGVQNGTVKREKLVLHNRMKWRRIARRDTAGAQRFTAGAQALSAAPLLGAATDHSNHWRPTIRRKLWKPNMYEYND